VASGSLSEYSTSTAIAIMSTMSSGSVQALYAHIHRLLDEHVALHLTTDYMDYTQLRVFQVNIATSDTSSR
jgi:bisphosphoglycerate-independent phosphoglycerate mutase (AlkP superfamily)